MVDDYSIQLFCFDAEFISEACNESFGLGNVKIVGTTQLYASIWITIQMNKDVKVDFYLTTKDLEDNSPTKTLTLSECYQIYRENQTL